MPCGSPAFDFYEKSYYNITKLLKKSTKQLMIFYNLPNCRLYFSERARAFFRAGRQSEAMEVAAVYTMLVVDDEYYLRLGFKSLLDWDALGIRIVGEAADGEEGLRLALREKPDLIVADIRMPYMNGLELMEKLRENHIESVVIVLSGFSEFEYAQKAIENGAFAYLLKPIDQDAFLDTVKRALVHIKTEKSSKQYYELLKSELSSMKEVFLKNLLEGAVRDREEIVKKIRMLDVPLDPGNNVAVVIRLDNFLLVRERKPFHLLFIEESVLLIDGGTTHTRFTLVHDGAGVSRLASRLLSVCRPADGKE